MGTNRLTLIAVSLATLVGLSFSCAETRHWTGADLPEASSSELRPLQFNDVPAPFGFDLQTSGNRSLTYQDGELRRGKLLYKGTDSSSKVVAFYRSQMIQAPYGWTALPETLEGNKIILKFRKQNSRSSVSIYSQDIFTFVQIEVEPTNET